MVTSALLRSHLIHARPDPIFALPSVRAVAEAASGWPERVVAREFPVADVDLGLASDWDEGDTHGRVRLRDNQVYPNTQKKDVVVSSPCSIELSVNTNYSTSQEADKVIFTTYHGTEKKIIAILDSNGDLYVAGRVIQQAGNLSYT
nr:DUF6342 family protein [Actinomadura rayongensis]